MGSMSIWHWIVVGLVFLLLFGKGRISDMMGDVAKGIKSFKKGMAEEDDAQPARPNPALTQMPPAAVEAEPVRAEQHRA